MTSPSSDTATTCLLPALPLRAREHVTARLRAGEHPVLELASWAADHESSRTWPARLTVQPAVYRASHYDRIALGAAVRVDLDAQLRSMTLDLGGQVGEPAVALPAVTLEDASQRLEFYMATRGTDANVLVIGVENADGRGYDLPVALDFLRADPEKAAELIQHILDRRGPWAL